MVKMKIIITPNPILTTPSQTVEKIDKEVLDFIEGMKNTLLSTTAHKGVGLAAPQVGKNWQIFITKPYDKSKIRVFLNAEIVEKSKELTTSVPERKNPLEGCLSIPSIWGTVKRYQTMKLRYKTPDNRAHTQQFSGFMATIIQHEIDHLEGRLFPSRTLEQKGKLYQAKKDTDGKESLEEMSFPI